MASAIKQISISKGHDPRDFALICSGGGGPLHGIELARELRIPKVIVPPEPGNFSAIGMLMADARLLVSRTFVTDLTKQSLEQLNEHFVVLEATNDAQLTADFGMLDRSFERYVELRYKGQKHSLKILINPNDRIFDIVETFAGEYLKRYGHNHPTSSLEMVGVHSLTIGDMFRPALEDLMVTQGSSAKSRQRQVFSIAGHDWVTADVYDRYALPIGFEAQGPALIEEYGSTTILNENDSFRVGTLGELQIDCSR